MTSALHMLSPHFSLAELCASEYALRHNLPNEPGDAEIANLSDLCNRVLEPIRSLVAVPFRPTSGYRSPEINAAIGGAPHSQHILGQAADFIIHGFTNRELILIIKDAPIVPYDQLILEFGDVGWVHCSFSNVHRRREVLVASKDSSTGKTVYTPFA